MLISDSHRFVFVHVPKTAGSTVVRLLRAHAIERPPAGLASLLRAVGLPRDWRRYRFPKHAPLRTAERRLPAEMFHNAFKFGFVRNPWDRLVSDYNAQLRDPTARRHARTSRLGSFARYLRADAPRGLATQRSLLIDGSGAIGVDFVGRFETLAADLAFVCDRLGLPRPPAWPEENRHPHADYRNYYASEDRDLVARHWREDIETFGYSFDG
ncbi:MAG: sulfotransferase family 2 domain-containing protein [Planctomycetes bacterium]|nr:sulfotransferase family 2 domain-containing protein [Planctomycetota bacterium]